MKRVLGLLLAVAASGLTLSAQGFTVGQPEVTAFAGLVAGVGTHGTIGGSAAVPLTTKLLVLGELSYIPVDGPNGFTFNGTAHYSLSSVLRTSSRFDPYGAFGLGAGRAGGETDFYVNFGGGGRYYVGSNWGVRPELMIFAGPNTFVRFTAGLFYQWGR